MWGNISHLSAIFKHPFRSSVSSARPLPCLVVRTLFSTHDTWSRAERFIRTLRDMASCAYCLHERFDRLLREGVGASNRARIVRFHARAYDHSYFRDVGVNGSGRRLLRSSSVLSSVVSQCSQLHPCAFLGAHARTHAPLGGKRSTGTRRGRTDAIVSFTWGIRLLVPYGDEGGRDLAIASTIPVRSQGPVDPSFVPHPWVRDATFPSMSCPWVWAGRLGGWAFPCDG